MIAISDLSVVLGGVHALSELSVELDAPIHGVIGPNGAGKTTLLNSLSGFVRPTSGAIVADGTSLHALNPRRRALWGLRRTFQAECLAVRQSAWANVAVMADATLPRAQRRAAVARALAFVGIEAPETPVLLLDGYQRRLVEIARALAGAPKVVLLDEPAGGLSTPQTRALADVIAAIPGTYGAQVVLIDHDVDLIATTCARATVLDFGRLLATGATAEVLADPHVRAAWLGTEEVA